MTNYQLTKTKLAHLKEDGVLALHISNLYIDLRQLVYNIANEYDLQSRIVQTAKNPNRGIKSAVWMLLTNNEAFLEDPPSRVHGGRHRDPEVRALLLAAGAESDLEEARVEAALRVVVGRRDEIAPPEWNARVLAHHAPGASLRELDEVGHYTFLSRCGWAGRILLGEICQESDGVDRGAK